MPIKRSIMVEGLKTSVSLEVAFWQSLKDIASARELSLADLATEIGRRRPRGNLSSAMRTYVLEYYRSMALAAAQPAGNASSPYQEL